jgi:hypothetical protein
MSRDTEDLLSEDLASEDLARWALSGAGALLKGKAELA